MPSQYSPAVSQLLQLGQPETSKYPDYLELGVGEEHVPELIRLATDDVLNHAAGDSLEVWGPFHAVRALGRLRAAEAVKPLLDYYSAIEQNDDATIDILPRTFSAIGPPAIAPLAACLADPETSDNFLIFLCESLSKIGEEYPDSRDQVARILIDQLEHWEEQDPEFNAFLICGLLNIRAAEAAPLIEKVFAGGRTTEFIHGDWEDVQIALGLLERRLTPARKYGFDSPHTRRTPGKAEIARSHAAHAKQKAKRKAAKQSRKRNRSK